MEMKPRYAYIGPVVFAVALFAAAIISCNGPVSRPESHNLRGGALGTTFSLVFFEEDYDPVSRAIDSVIDTVNASMSTYHPNSLISRINGGEELAVDPMFREVMEISEEVYTKSNGYFDPTVGVLVNAWGFGPLAGKLPDSSQVDSLLRYVGFPKVHIDEQGILRKELPGIRLDFNAVAKGYAIDRVGIALEELGLSDYMFELGGEIVVKGINQHKKQPWTIGIEDPVAAEEGSRTTRRLVRLNGGAMASSGNYRKFRIDSVTGEKYVHTIDPISGYSKNSAILATSVLAPDCARADAYATALMAMDLQDGMDLLQANDQIEGYIIYLDEENRLREYFTPGFKERFYYPQSM